MLAFIEAAEGKNTITIDGYTSNKTEKGIIRDVARAVRKYSENEADALLSHLEYDLDEYNNPFIKNNYSENGYFFEYEEVPCATRYNEKTDETEYKERYKIYFCIRIVK